MEKTFCDRRDCPMRHKNGNGLPCGGFCTAVNDEIGQALHEAYQHGFTDGRAEHLWDMPAIGGFHDYD